MVSDASSFGGQTHEDGAVAIAELRQRVALLEGKMPQSAFSDAIEGHSHHAIITRVATTSDLPATRQRPTLYAVALTPNAAPRVFVVYAGGQIELDATGGGVVVHTHAIDDDLTGFPIDATQHGTQSTGDLHPEYVREALLLSLTRYVIYVPMGSDPFGTVL